MAWSGEEESVGPAFRAEKTSKGTGGARWSDPVKVVDNVQIALPPLGREGGAKGKFTNTTWQLGGVITRARTVCDSTTTENRVGHGTETCLTGAFLWAKLPHGTANIGSTFGGGGTGALCVKVVYDSTVNDITTGWCVEYMC